MAANGQKAGSLFAPLLLRVVLGVTFVWAGLSKLVPIVEYKGQDAAILANLGTGIVPARTVKTGAPVSADPPTLAPPATLPLPDPSTTNPTGTPPSGKPKPSSRQQKKTPDVGYTAQGTALAAVTTTDLPPAADAVKTKGKQPANGAVKLQPPPSNTPATPQTNQPANPSVTSPVQPPAANKQAQSPALETLPPGGKYTAADFTEPARARRAYSLSVLLVRAAYPQPSVGVPNPKPYWPKIFATSPWVIWIAFGAAVIELFAGVLLMVGFLTRLSALMLVLVMTTAMWLTQIGPAVSIGQTAFGLLPDKTWWDAQLWSTFFWQLLIMATGVAIACMGSGALSVDRALAVIGSGGPKAEQDPSPKG